MRRRPPSVESTVKLNVANCRQIFAEFVTGLRQRGAAYTHPRSSGKGVQIRRWRRGAAELKLYRRKLVNADASVKSPRLDEWNLVVFSTIADDIRSRADWKPTATTSSGRRRWHGYISPEASWRAPAGEVVSIKYIADGPTDGSRVAEDSPTYAAAWGIILIESWSATEGSICSSARMYACVYMAESASVSRDIQYGFARHLTLLSSARPQLLNLFS